MKALFLAAVLFISTQVQATEKTEEKEVAIGISGVYVPGHFDSSSEAYLVVNGIFPNGCYRWKHAVVADKDSMTHEITSYAAVNQGMCLMVLIPFQKEIRLGQLAKGQHLVRFMNGDGTYLEKQISVE